MSMTLLEMTQKIINKLKGSPVDSIEDTTESMVYANEIIDTYYIYHSRSNDNWTKNKFRLVDVSKYVLALPSEVQSTAYMKYNGVHLKRLSTNDFENLLLSNRGKDGYDEEGYGINKDPEYYTSYDDINIELNSIDTSKEVSANGANTICYGKVRPIIPMPLTDDYVLSPLPPALFDAVLSDATGSCLNRFREKSAQYDRENAVRIKERNNLDSRTQTNYLYINNDDNTWGF